MTRAVSRPSEGRHYESIVRHGPFRGRRSATQSEGYGRD
jgi:hypothetical protein